MSQSPSSSSIVQIKLTDPGEGLTEAEIIDIKVSVGDTIAINDAVIEVETAKSAVELPSHVGGTVTAILIAVGDEAPVGTPLLEVDTAGGPAPAPEEQIGRASCRERGWVPEVAGSVRARSRHGL